jgi:hypothetical protein
MGSFELVSFVSLLPLKHSNYLKYVGLIDCPPFSARRILFALLPLLPAIYPIIHSFMYFSIYVGIYMLTFVLSWTFLPSTCVHFATSNCSLSQVAIFHSSNSSPSSSPNPSSASQDDLLSTTSISPCCWMPPTTLIAHESTLVFKPKDKDSYKAFVEENISGQTGFLRFVMAFFVAMYLWSIAATHGASSIVLSFFFYFSFVDAQSLNHLFFFLLSLVGMAFYTAFPALFLLLVMIYFVGIYSAITYGIVIIFVFFPCC